MKDRHLKILANELFNQLQDIINRLDVEIGNKMPRHEVKQYVGKGLSALAYINKNEQDWKTVDGMVAALDELVEFNGVIKRISKELGKK